MLASWLLNMYLHHTHTHRRVHTHTCMPDSSSSHWIIFSLAFNTPLFHHSTILLLSLHAPFLLALTLLYSSCSSSGCCVSSFLLSATTTITLASPPITGWVSSYLTTLSCSSERRCSRVCEVTASSASPASLLATALSHRPPLTVAAPPPLLPSSFTFPPCFFCNACFLPPLLKASEKRRCTAHASFCTCFCGVAVLRGPDCISCSRQPCSYFAL